MDADEVKTAIVEGNTAALNRFLANLQVIRSLDDPAKDYLCIALGYGRTEFVELLLGAGASPNVTSPGLFRLTPLAYALKFTHDFADHDRLIDMLIRAGADVNEHERPSLTYPRTVAAVERLLAAGADPRLPGAEPCLVAAVLRDNLDVVKALLAAGADPSVASELLGWTPLHGSAQVCDPEAVQVLLDAGADALTTDYKGNKPLKRLHLHDHGTPEERQAITAALVAAGDHNWDLVPTPCLGLQRALVPTWKDAPEELPQLFRRLQPAVQVRAQAALKIFHPHNVPVHLRMDLLSASLED